MSPKKSKATSSEVEELSTVEALNVEAPAQSGEDRSESPNAAPIEAKAVRSESVLCGPLRLTQHGKGYGWAEHPLHPTPHAAVTVFSGPHGYGAAASLGQAGIVRMKATHSKPDQAAAELEQLITAGLTKARASQVAMVERAQARPGFPPEQRQLSQAEQDLVLWCSKAGWPGADPR